MGIYLRDSRYGPHGDFLTPHGVVRTIQNSKVSFTQQAFVSPAKVDEFVAYYEKVEVFEHNRMSTDEANKAVSAREKVAPIVENVHEFLVTAREIQADYYRDLHVLYDTLSHETEVKTILTQDAAKMVFGEDYTPQQLYATHMTFMGDGLRYLGDRGFHRVTSRFRIRSQKDVRELKEVITWVRKSSASFTPKGYGEESKGPLKDFIAKSVALIDQSRKLASEKPETPGVPVERVELPDMKWTEDDRKFISFLSARMKAYGLQQTPIEGLVPYILRQTKRYTTKTLDGACTYDFLSEIGVFSGWENLSLHAENQELPGYHVSKQADADQVRMDEVKGKSLEELNMQDSLKSVRKDWGDLKVYAIDDATAEEIDDGISIEKVSEEETWIHVHVANPTAFLDSDHWIAEIAKNRITTKYLSPHTFRMLPAPISEALGVRSGGPVLTFSTKINRSGDIVDFQVQPGTVNIVQRMTYKQLGQILDMPVVPIFSIAAGSTPIIKAEGADYTPSEKDLDELKSLQQCFLDLTRRRTRNGMVSVRNVQFDYQLSPEATQIWSGADLVADHPTLFRGYPSIELSIDETPRCMGPEDFVAEFMILANSAIAEHATKNNIPMPFRTLEFNEDRPEIIDAFKKLILPNRNEYGISSRSVIDDLAIYIGVGYARLMTASGPHVVMGLPQGYVKATSPLRRYGDMIVHWNLQAHLLNQPAPFPIKKLESLLPDIDLKERMANYGSKESMRFWGTYALGKLIDQDPVGYKSRLPTNMTMTVLEISPWPTPCVGICHELATTGKVSFNSAAAAKLVAVGDRVAVSVKEARLGEKMVMFNGAEVVKKKELE